MFVENQYNHVRRSVAAVFDALNEYQKFKVGRVVSGPGKKQTFTLFLEKGSFY